MLLLLLLVLLPPNKINVWHIAALLIFFAAFLVLFFFSPLFSYVLPRPELVQHQQHLKRKISGKKIFWGEFCKAFFAKTTEHMPILHFFVLCVHVTQVLLSNFIKNTFCYFSSSGSMSNAQIIELICMNSQKGLLNKFFCNLFSESLLVFFI